MQGESLEFWEFFIGREGAIRCPRRFLLARWGADGGWVFLPPVWRLGLISAAAQLRTERRTVMGGECRAHGGASDLGAVGRGEGDERQQAQTAAFVRSTTPPPSYANVSGEPTGLKEEYQKFWRCLSAVAVPTAPPRTSRIFRSRVLDPGRPATQTLRIRRWRG